MVPSGFALALPAVVLAAALVIDRVIGDPHTSSHPVALLGRFIGWWGRPSCYPVWLQRTAGMVLWVCTIVVFTTPFFLFSRFSPFILFLIGAPLLLKTCFAWRSLEEHVSAVTEAVQEGLDSGRSKVQLLVSRQTGALDREAILSAAYESMTENLTDSIVAPLLFFAVFGIAGAAFYRAANTMDAMLGYMDERMRLGWFSARMDDLLTYIPARITVFLLLIYFASKGRFRQAVAAIRRDGKNRPGYNGGIVMAAMAGGVGVRFEKPGIYMIGDPTRSLQDGGPEIVYAVNTVVLLGTVLVATVAAATLFLLGSWINSMGI